MRVLSRHWIVVGAHLVALVAGKCIESVLIRGRGVRSADPVYAGCSLHIVRLN